jgi:1-acyl-sn-glycerol-3-phosphate acyltransferase
MAFTGYLVNTTIKNIIRIICRVDDSQLDRIPHNGPLILAVNHINFLDAPLVYTHLQPRPLTGFAKAETWDNPILGSLFSFWEAIPLERGEADIGAIRQCLSELNRGKIIAIAPEGTRSGNGRLQCGRPGVVMIALRSKAPILPMAYYGGEMFKQNISRLKRTDFHISVGYPFRIRVGGKITQDVRRRITDEIMYQIAALLPPPYRGYYSDLTNATEQYLVFEPPARSDLDQAVTELEN